MVRRKTFLGVVCFIVLLLLSYLLWISVLGVHAQDAPEQMPVNTSFQQGCLEALDEATYKLHIVYMSDGVESFMFTLGAVVGSNAETVPYTGTITTNIPETFTTSAGVHDDFYLLGTSEDSPYQFTLQFTNALGTAELPVSTWEADGTCAAPDPLSAPTPEPVPAPLPQSVFVDTVRSTGRVCVVHYPNIVLVCNGKG